MGRPNFYELSQLSGAELREKIGNIKRMMLQGEISYDDAKVLAGPIIAEMNRRGVEIATKYSKKYRPLTFTQLMR